MNVEELICRLQEAGIRTWFDRENLVPGNAWQRHLEEVVVASEVFVIF
jgi:hypothetical protein